MKYKGNPIYSSNPIVKYTGYVSFVALVIAFLSQINK